LSAQLEQRKDAELAEGDAQRLAQAAIADIDPSDLQLPVIKIIQQMSKENTNGDAEPGTFFNTVTSESYGDELEFVIVRYAKGRFYVHNRDQEDERSFVANGKVAPDTWPEQYAGKTFVDIPDAEEQWKARSNAGEQEWGKGPPIVTTHNFVGFVADEPGVPARLGFSRTSAPAAKKVLSILSFSNREAWDSTFKFKLIPETKRNKTFYVAKSAQGAQTDVETRGAAQQLAALIEKAGSFALTGDEVEDADKSKGEKPQAPAGGVKV
jgi:hypothetical protein